MRVGNNRALEFTTLILVVLVIVTRYEQARLPDNAWLTLLTITNGSVGILLCLLARRFARIDHEISEAVIEVSGVIAGDTPTYSECLHRAAMRKRRQDIIYATLGIWGKLGVPWTFAVCFGLFVFLADFMTCSLQVAIVAFLGLRRVCHTGAKRMVALLDATQKLDNKVIAAVEGK